jgi:hypothetical protein
MHELEPGHPARAHGDSEGKRREREELSLHGRRLLPSGMVEPLSRLLPGVVSDVGKQRQKARALNGPSERALMIRARSRDAPRHDLSAVRDVALEPVNVFVVDDLDPVCREPAGSAAAIVTHAGMLLEFFEFFCGSG